MKSKKSLIVLVVTVLIIIVAALAVRFKVTDASKKMNAVPTSTSVFYDETYQTYLEQNGYDGTTQDAELQIDLNNYTISDGMLAENGVDGLITGDSGAITWNFNVEKAGFYNLQIGYIAQPGTTSDIQRRILINGESCYEGLEQIVFKRFWNDEEISEKNGNEIRPNTYEVFKETKVFIEDYEKRVGEPYLFYLSKGKNTITFEVIKEPLEYTSIVFKKAEKAEDYETVISVLKTDYSIYDGENIICQAERAEGSTIYMEKNSSSINIQKNYSDSLLVPYHPYLIKYNTIGANSWRQPGNSISWEVKVPKEGLYELTFKGRQSLKRGVTSCRRLYINGVVPYSNMNAINFGYSSDMANYTVAAEDGTPYLFYLKEGSNTIELECVMGDFGGVINEIEESMYQLNQLYLSVIQITGQSPDKFIDYQIEEKIPEFKTTMASESERLFRMVDEVVAITGEKGENTSLIEKMAMEAKWLSEDPESVTEEITQLKNNISALGTWMVTISEMPLELDSIVISGETVDLPKAQNSAIKNFYYGSIRFLSTFFVDSNQISGENTASEDVVTSEDKTIKVWMAATGNTQGVSIGREQAQIIQNMIDEELTPQEGIKVNLQLIPVDVVLRAALAGNSPDVVIGLAGATLQDFAMRGAVVDLSQFEGYTETSEKYFQSTIDAASYQGGVYGIPEQANFMMMFCRNDILQKIGADIPKTWEEVKEILPVLKKNNYEFYLPTAQSGANLYPSMVYQFGGDLYEGEGTDYGIASALDQEPAMLAFKTYTDLFNSYGLLVQADFPNRFRTGEMPIGIINYTTYCQLEIFAPEIKGLWSFVPLPGYENQNGTINNSYIVDTVQSTIMESSEKQQVAWDFVQWWTETDTQLSYANTVESVMGTAARYPAADPEVLKQLPWSNSELTQLLSQLENTVGVPAIPGNYMTTRMVLYSFNKVVADLANSRETLYLNVKSIDKELTKKREEFHLSTAQ